MIWSNKQPHAHTNNHEYLVMRTRPDEMTRHCSIVLRPAVLHTQQLTEDGIHRNSVFDETRRCRNLMLVYDSEVNSM